MEKIVDHRKFVLYFVVPESIFENFGKQSYCTVDGKTAQNVPQWIRELPQYVMKIKM